MKYTGRRWSLLFLLVRAALAAPAAIEVEYPRSGSLFPPDFMAPTFLFRDTTAGVTSWRVEVSLGGGQPLRVECKGERMKVGEIDERVISNTNKLPALTPEQEQLRTWKPDAATWAAIRKGSVGKPAVITFLGIAGGSVVSRGEVRIQTAKEAVGAPIFFRDVPLMPAEVEKGVIKPLPKNALPLVAWRLQYVSEERSRKLIDDVPTCMNCHSFSRDGKTLGLDLDGPSNDKGLYALVSIDKQATIRNQDVVAWSSFKGKLGSKIRVGFMSQVSPDARYVVTMVSPADLGKDPAPGGPALPKDVRGNFYVQNFKDYRFLQVFYPTRGILAWYSRETGKLQPLPGADDPRYVHTNATWSPDGKYLVFARAESKEAYTPGKVAKRANDPEETPIQYDLYRIPFNDGKGGTPEPIVGASSNGMSNSFPKISPDGQWIVYVQARNGLLMRPDGRLHIVPAAGGKSREMSCNTSLMNSWHSFSPNGRWLVFSSKSRSPYTQMFLTHIDENGMDSPAILIENSTAANRAVNIPEFVNVPMDGWLKIEAPATEFYRLSDAALDLLTQREYDKAVEQFNKALEMEPEDTSALNNLGAAYSEAGNFERAFPYFRKALELDPDNYKAHHNYGVALANAGQHEEAKQELEKAIELNKYDARSYSVLGGVLVNMGRFDEARVQLQRALEEAPDESDALNNLGSLYAREGNFGEAEKYFARGVQADPESYELSLNLGRVYAAQGRLNEAIGLVEKARDLSGGRVPLIFDRLAGIYAKAGRWADALAAAKRGLEVAAEVRDDATAESIRSAMPEYEARAPK